MAIVRELRLVAVFLVFFFLWIFFVVFLPVGSNVFFISIISIISTISNVMVLIGGASAGRASARSMTSL